MTPLQKSIAEINKLYTDLHYGSFEPFELLNLCKQILTDNLQYEREVIETAYRQGETDYITENVDGTGCDYKSASDYYIKTYEHERKD